MTSIRHRFLFFDQSASAVEAFSRPSRGRFDDFKVTHTKSPVIQAEDYYPFGLVASSYRRENSLEQNFLYNGKELQDELNLGWLDYGARMYMPEIGRWGVVDPLAEKYYKWSPFNYSINNPIRFVDPDGRGILDKIVKIGTQYVANKTEQFLKNSAKSAGVWMKSVAKDFKDNTKLELKTELKTSDKIGAEFDFKGVGGGGVSLTMKENTKVASVELGFDNGKIDSKTSETTSTEMTLELKGQMKGNGAFVKQTKGENNSTEVGITTESGIPAVQTETSVKVGDNGGEISTGIAGGATTPYGISFQSGFVKHISVGISFKLIYEKKND